MTATLHSVRFPNESADYRAARDRLLETEMELRRKVEDVAAQRRMLPLGGEIRENYVFQSESGSVRMSELFQDGKDSLIIYSYMYGPEMETPCSLCTCILDAIDGEAPHIMQRVNLVAVAKRPIGEVLEIARERNWRNLRLLSSSENSYNKDYQGEDADGDQWPALNVFVRRNGKIFHTNCTELLFVPSESEQDFRSVDMIWPLWNVLDFAPEGRGEDWYPKLSYK